VKNLFSPGPLDREATEKYFPARDRQTKNPRKRETTKKFFTGFRNWTGPSHNEGAGGKVFLTKRISWSD
jgi:hypothetical protein